MDEFEAELQQIRQGGLKDSALRLAYEREVAALRELPQRLRAEGMTEEHIARTMHQARRELDRQYKLASPPLFREYIYAATAAKYGDPLGPSFEALRETKTCGQIIESASRPIEDLDDRLMLDGFRAWYLERGKDGEGASFPAGGAMKRKERRMRGKQYLFPALMLAVFEIIAVTLWRAKGNLFYLFNFSYIGLSISLGMFLFLRKRRYARRMVQLLVGLYMLVYLGIICRENMQIEGFWYYLFTGVFEAATIHYAVAKIFGPLLFGRGWCGYACWTAMVLDFLPYKTPQGPRKRLGWLRYVTFAASLCFVAALFLARVGDMERIMFRAFLIGNVAYYGAGIALAFALRDNRAFCKYLCPITVFLKPMSYFSLLRVKCDRTKCISCGKCRRACPMDVDVTDNSRRRRNGTECILCMECVRACPKDAL